jgi:hypothetical protein
MKQENNNKVLLKYSKFDKRNQTMKRYSAGNLLVVISLILFGCLGKSEAPNEWLIEYSSFDEGPEGWIAEFAGYPASMEDSMRLSFKYESIYISKSIGNVSAFKQSGYAANSDLFMYIKQRVSGLRPNARYLVSIQVELNSQLLEKYNGDLNNEDYGSFLKVGALNSEPLTMETLNVNNTDIAMVTADFDKGENSKGGIDMTLIGRIEYTDVGASPIMLNGSNADYPIYAATDDYGKLWIAVGVDTNIPVYQEIAYTYIVATFEFQNDL